MASGGYGLSKPVAFVLARDGGLPGDVTATPAATTAVPGRRDFLGQVRVSFPPTTYSSTLRVDGLLIIYIISGQNDELYQV